jgi:hypothetical protein
MANDEATAKRTPVVLGNGSIVSWVPHPWNRWGITSGDGVHQGMRSTLERALEFAATLPMLAPEPEPQVHQLSRSERAKGFFGESNPVRFDVGQQPEERKDFDYSRPAPGAPVEQRRNPIAESREKSRRQARAHGEVYGRRR